MLPDRTTGSALFADISGFTVLTESLRKALGARQGAEALSRQMEEVFSALVAEVEMYGGSVINFAGDSMLCWFDRGIHEIQASSSSALSAAMGMQNVMQTFSNLALKVSIASGNSRRFVVGDETIQRLDVLAGATISRTAVGEHLATKGDIVVDEATVKLLGDSSLIKEWREEGGERFALVENASTSSEQPSAQRGDAAALLTDYSILRPFIHHAVYQREISGQGSFLTEFRPCVALFIRFSGLNYDADDEVTRLDEFVQTVQRVAERYHGILLQITIGDKGSYAYVNFGALSAHEDDSRRAVKTALELRNKTELQLQMGITQGLMRVGAYGGVTRKAFGALGDDVNLAARLMTTAKENEILLSSDVHKAMMGQFTFEPHPPVPMKGKAEPLPVFAVTDEIQRRAVRLQEPNYSLPMVGRQAELKLIEEKLDLAKAGKSQVIGIVAEAGLGKSRLVAEMIRNAKRKGFVGFGGACQSDGIHTPYLAWKSIWQAFFDVDPEMSERKLIRWLKGEIEDRAPSRLNAMPLLNVVLDLNIPENDFTQNLEPKIRQSALHALLEDCLKAQAKDEPTLIVIEDLHWIDALSHDLLEGLAKALANYAVCFVLAYRPLQMERLQNPRIEALEQFSRIELHELTTLEAESAVRAKLTQLYPARGGALPAGLVEALMKRAQGNPFYLEELLNYVRDRGLDPSDIQNIELPDSLHTLILSRIDQLSEAEKITLRVASIIGRLFRAKWLTGYYPELGSFPQVKAALDALSGLDITPLDSPEPELAYLFKHIVTHEVTYESLPFATRARLHEQLARYLENADALVETIAFHYGRSENKAKQVEYLHKAGEASQKNYANNAALDYYGSLLPLLIDVKEKTKIHLRRGEVLELIGNYDDAESDYRAALDSAKDDMALIASVQYALGKLNRNRGNYGPALEWLVKAKETYTALGDNARLAQVLIETGTVLFCEGDLTQAGELCNKGLILAREAGDSLGAALALRELGGMAWQQGDRVAARTLAEESLNLRRAMGDKRGIASSLLDLGSVVCEQGDYAKARMLYEESLSMRSGMGDKSGIADSLYMLGKLAYWQGEYVAARASFEESLSLCREMGDKSAIALALTHLGNVVSSQSDYAAAQALHEESLRLCREMGFKLGSAIALVDVGYEAYLQGDYIKARLSYEECLALCKEMDEKQVMAYALFGLGLLDLTVNKPEAREHILHSLRLRWDTGERLQQTSSLIGAAGLVLEEGNPQFAAELLGAVESVLKGLGAVMEPELKPFHTRTLEAARGQLGKVAFQSAWEEGGQWSLEEAVKKVLGD
ncbi:MAG: tetratricopeptide repeat protein [Anaerolineales bacterium]|nr:tetratricopeptide repeat protein [Anaerolineales bacterium]